MREQLALLALTCAGALAGQDRDLVAGRVVDRDGEPWAGATVVLAATLMPAAPDLAGIDRVEVTTDARGIFRAQVLPDLAYAAWVAAFDEQRRLRRTELVHDVRPGAVVRLVEQSPVDDPRLTVLGLEAWAAHGPLRVELRSEVAELGSETLTLDDGRAPLPAWPDAPLLVVIRDTAGEPIALEACSPTGGDNASRFQVLIHPPRSIPCVVTDADGAPIAGARIRCQVGTITTSLWPGGRYAERKTRIWRSGPLTDADGRATIALPLALDPFTPGQRPDPGALVLLEAARPGFGRSYGGLYRGIPFLDGRKTSETPQEFGFRLRPSSAITGRLELAAGRPLAGHPVLLAMDGSITGNTTNFFLPLEFRVETGADGTFSLADAPPDATTIDAHFALPGSLLRRWSRTSEGHGCRHASIAFPDDRERHEPAAVILGTFREVRIRIGAEPAEPRSPVLVVPLQRDEFFYREDIPWLATTDASGHLTLRLPPGRFGVVWTGRDSWVAGEFEVTADEAPLRVDLPERDYSWMRFAVETDDGPARAGRPTIGTHSFSPSGEPVAPLANLRAALTGHLVRSRRIEDGHLDIPLFPDLTELSASIRIHVEGGGTSPPIPLEPRDGRRTIRID